MAHRAVIIFFTLSGFLVGGSVLRALKRKEWSWLDYGINRATRLYTVLIPALFSCLLLDWFASKAPRGLQLFTTWGWHCGPHGPLSFLANLVFLQGIFVPTYGTNDALWSLACEFWYYIAFPLLALGVYRAKGLKRFLYLGAFLALCSVKPSVSLLGLVWMMGVAIHYLPPWTKAGRIFHCAAIVVCVSLMAGASLTERRLPKETLDLLFGILAAALLWLLISMPRLIQVGLFDSAAGHLSKISYTLYLFHLPALVLFISLLNHERRVLGSATLFSALIPLAMVMAFAELAYRVFEIHTDSIRSALVTMTWRRSP